MASNKELIRRWRQARSGAYAVLNDESSALPDSSLVDRLTVAIFQADLAGGELFDGPTHGGADGDQENMLRTMYGKRN